ncbi:hypothetical protein DE4585_04895 [Mycobacteroides salmoniphilum]|uniref:Uncharacterized protein n=1 Tax=Mycobacteroides salmoniphilum TaxID=404941 RepID=A0A4R8S283_9MYCO|nr:hypothetical protein DE4585_04895 [Mycobacteroides salmoniphilum]
MDARIVRPVPSLTATDTTRSVTNRAVSLTSFSDLLAVAAPQNDAGAQSNPVGTGVPSSSDLIGTVAKLLTASQVASTGSAPGITAAAVDPVDPPVEQPVDPPVEQPTDPPAADEPAPPTNFPGTHWPAFGTPSYFAQLAFAVFHVVALPITVPVQFFIGSAEGVPTVIAAALNDLSGLLGQIPGFSPQQPAATQAQQKVAEASSVLPKTAAAEAEAPAAEEPAPAPAPEPLPTNFPGPRPAFGTPSYFAQLAFAVLHVLALPITVPVQAIIGTTEGVPTVIAAALNDLSSLLGQVPKISLPGTDPGTTPAASSKQVDQAVTKPETASEKSDTTKRDADVKTSNTEHGAKPAETAAESPKTEHEAKPADTATDVTKVDPTKAVEPKVDEPKVDPAKAVEPKVDPAKVVEPKVEPAKVVEPKVDPSKVVEPKVEPAKAVEPKVDPAKAVEPKVDPAAAQPTKPEPAKPAAVKPEPAKPEPASPVKVVRDSLKSTPGGTTTTGGTKTTEGSKGAETDSKTPAASTATKVREGSTPSVGGTSDKPAEKPSTEKSSPEKSSTGKSTSSSEGNSHSSEGKSHASEGKSHSGSTD